MILPSICIITAASKDNANLVWAAMGRGPNTFTRKLCEDANATSDTPPTHYLMADSSSEASDVAAWQAMANGDLPPVPEGTVWGEDGVISAADAMAATSASNLQVYSASGDVTPVDHMNGILLGRSLYVVPDEL